MSSRLASYLVVVASLFSLACDSGGEDGNTQECPAGSGSIFVANGPDGPGCYCPAGTVPNTAGNQCVTGDPCGPYGRSDGAGGCDDIDECAEGTSGCATTADCTNVTMDAPRCACKRGYEGDGKT